MPEPGVKVLYISPLKALGVDVDRNLRAPLAGISAVAARDNGVRAAGRRGVPPRGIHVADPETLEEEVIRALTDTSMFAARFLRSA